MTLPANGARGEVALCVGSVDLVIAAEIGRLAAVSAALGCQSFGELYQRLLGVEIAALIAGVRHLAVRGDVEAAVQGLKLSDLPACKAAFAAALNHSFGGKAAAAAKKARRPRTKSPSPGTTG
jgi:hypothetical protein